MTTTEKSLITHVHAPPRGNAENSFLAPFNLYPSTHRAYASSSTLTPRRPFPHAPFPIPAIPDLDFAVNARRRHVSAAS